jgi:Tol biopolymer transport system component
MDHPPPRDQRSSPDTGGLRLVGLVLLMVVALGGCSESPAGPGDGLVPPPPPPPGSEEPPPPALVVFDMVLEGQRDIWRVLTDGSGLGRLTDSPWVDREPTVAAGNVVFVSIQHGNPELLRVALEGGERERLTTTAGSEAGPTLSPDGSALAWIYSGSGVPKLQVAPVTMPLPGPPASRATGAFGTGASVEASPAFAPDGRRIAFVSTHEGNANLYLLDRFDGAFEPLLVGPAAYGQPAWSPDGARIAYASNEAGSTDLWVLELASGVRTRLIASPSTDAAPAWLPDGRIVFVRHGTEDTELRWIDPRDPTTTHRIPLPEGGRPMNPAAPR